MKPPTPKHQYLFCQISLSKFNKNKKLGLIAVVAQRIKITPPSGGLNIKHKPQYNSLLILLTAELLTTHHTLLAMEANGNTLFEFLIGGPGHHLTATPKYGV